MKLADENMDEMDCRPPRRSSITYTPPWLRSTAADDEAKNAAGEPDSTTPPANPGKAG